MPTLHHVVHDGVAELSVAAELAELLHPVGGQHQVGHSLQARPAVGDHQVQASVQLEGLLLSSLHVPLQPRRLRRRRLEEEKKKKATQLKQLRRTPSESIGTARPILFVFAGNRRWGRGGD